MKSSFLLNAFSVIPILAFLVAPAQSTRACSPASYFYFPSIPADYSTDVLYESFQGIALDSPKLDILNSSTWDWWYFDVVSYSLDQTISVVFTISDPVNFAAQDLFNETTFVQIHARFLNETRYLNLFPAKLATIKTEGEGSWGQFVGSGMSWDGTADLSKYVLTFDDNELGINGSITLDSVSGGHIQILLIDLLIIYELDRTTTLSMWSIVQQPEP
jgi:hypothetical protein